MTQHSSQLAYAVFVSDGPARAGAERSPDGSPLVWSPLSSTLIYGQTEAVLVDPPFTFAQVAAVGDWVEKTGRRLSHIYVTHGHGDHWFGSGELVQRFPDAKVIATKGTIELMHQQAGVGREQLWDRIFPGQIPETPVLAEPVPGNGITLEGNAIVPVDTGHTDTDMTSVLHVPSLRLVVAGDVVYNGVHQYISEGGNGGLAAWLRALDIVDALRPNSVVAGHKNRELADDPGSIGETRRYLHDVIELLDLRPTPGEFFDEMVRRYPERLNPSPVWYGGQRLLGA